MPRNRNPRPMLAGPIGWVAIAAVTLLITFASFNF